jgi:predicted acyltransferase
LLSDAPPHKKVSTLLLAAAISLVLGYVIDAVGITPIIKRIATSSFVLVSLGWSLLVLAACYWWIDTRDHRRHLEFFTIIGMNSIFIYLFFEIVGDRWFTAYTGAVTNGLMQMAHIPVIVMEIVTSLCVFLLEWGLCYFLYRKKIFFRV